MVDERFLMHRLKSTRLAMMVGVVLICALFMYYYLSNKVLRWDLFIILVAVAVTKIAAMLYYRRTN
ncbi:MAG: hypothetical protein JSV33_08950 [bacterium]|nr:MAG: hypothetical protein JSV33_08950 [bacterium]